jgi:hypothetical protein
MIRKRPWVSRSLRMPSMMTLRGQRVLDVAEIN